VSLFFIGLLGAFNGLGRRRSRTGQRPEHLFAGAAAGAFPVVGQILKSGAWRNFPLFISPGRIVNITAVGRLALPHIFGLGLFHRAPPLAKQLSTGQVENEKSGINL
jgi:hypothetical protein